MLTGLCPYFAPTSVLLDPHPDVVLEQIPPILSIDNLRSVAIVTQSSTSTAISVGATSKDDIVADFLTVNSYSST